MSEDEYMAGEPNDEDEFEHGDILGSFLIDEPPDIDVILMPKLDFNLENTVETYYKQIKKCRNKEQIKVVLRQYFAYISAVTSLQNDMDYLQNRAKELEFNIQLMQNSL